MSTRDDFRAQSREKAEQHLDAAATLASNWQAEALVGIGYAVLHLADVLRRIGAYWIGKG